MPDQQPIDPKEALIHIRTLIRVASDSYDINAVHKLLKEMHILTDKALSKGRK